LIESSIICANSIEAHGMALSQTPSMLKPDDSVTLWPGTAPVDTIFLKWKDRANNIRQLGVSEITLPM
jgi:hypothetical protein